MWCRANLNGSSDLKNSPAKTLTGNGEYRNGIAEDRPAFALHLRLLAMTAAGAHRQILHAFDSIGDGRCADADAHVIGPELLSAFCIESHDITGYLAGKNEVAGGGKNTPEHQVITGILPGDLA